MVYKLYQESKRLKKISYKNNTVVDGLGHELFYINPLTTNVPVI